MSYILDALRKAERERHLGQPPNLTAPPLAAEPGRRRLGPWLGVAGAKPTGWVARVLWTGSPRLSGDSRSDSLSAGDATGSPGAGGNCRHACPASRDSEAI